MQYRPHVYQEVAQRMILDHPACGLLLDMGLGKTVVTLTAIDSLIYDSYDVSKVLVIAPLRVARETWAREVDKWDHLQHLRVSKILGTALERKLAMAADADIYVINRENVPWLVETIGRKAWPYDMVVVDELSSFKSASSQRFKALRRVRGEISRIVGLTGTPTPNGLIDLWPQVYLLDQGERLGKTLTGYRSRYFDPDKRNATTIFSWRPKDGAEESIYGKLADICVSMAAGDYLTLPDRIDIDVPITLPRAAADAYKRLERDSILRLGEGTVAALQAATLINKLLQAANGAIYDDTGNVVELHDAKLDALEDLVEQAQGKPMLVYYSYKHDRARILERIPEAADLDVEQWLAGKQPVALAHPASAGHGLNLQAGGSTMIWFGHPWSLELYEQANARLHRQGQTEPVRIYHLVSTGTADEQVMAGLTRKAINQDALLEALKHKHREERNQ